MLAYGEATGHAHAIADIHVEAYERDVIKERLREFEGHATKAAKSLDLERSHLYKKMRAFGIAPSRRELE